MLILARRQEERFRIGDDVLVTITSLKDGVVQIGVDAPKSVSIQRG